MRKPDVITRKRAELEEQRARLVQQIEKVDIQLAVLVELDADSKSESETESKSDSKSKLASAAEPAPQPAGKRPLAPDAFKHGGLTENALKAALYLAELAGKPVTKAEVGALMREHGFKPSGKNFLISLDQSLRRLAAQNKLKTALQGNQRVYCAP